MNNMFLKLKKGTVPESIILGRVPLLTDSLFTELICTLPAGLSSKEGTYQHGKGAIIL